MASIDELRIDVESQILRVRMTGDFTASDTEVVIRRMAEAMARLDDPDHVRVLSDGRGLGKIDAVSRKLVMDALMLPRMERYAMWGIPRHRALFMRTLFRISGIRTFRIFDTESEAVAWLREGRG